MVLKNYSVATACALLLGWSSASAEDAYRPNQFLGLDLSRAVLSPKRLGPPAEFEPLAVEARAIAESEGPQAGAERPPSPGSTCRATHCRFAR